MLRSAKELGGYPLVSREGEAIGQVHDFYFDDRAWIILYLVVDTGVWLPGRKVLISPLALGQPPRDGGLSLPVALTRTQIENSPPIAADKPISRQQETELYEYYEWPPYWSDVTPLDAKMANVPGRVYVETLRQAAQEQEPARAEPTVNPYLRSMDEVIDYRIQATDGEIGHVEDFIVEAETWTIRYLVIDTRNWWPGKKVLVVPQWADDISWTDSRVYVNLTREAIKGSPEYDPAMPVNREYESRYYDYYGRPKYWL
jgi:uncharacterized protein YrrD